MSEPKISVARTEKLGPDLIVYFGDGSSAIFHAKFLFDMQNHDHNVPLKTGEPSYQS